MDFNMAFAFYNLRLSPPNTTVAYMARSCRAYNSKNTDRALASKSGMYISHAQNFKLPEQRAPAIEKTVNAVRRSKQTPCSGANRGEKAHQRH